MDMTGNAIAANKLKDATDDRIRKLAYVARKMVIGKQPLGILRQPYGLRLVFLGKVYRELSEKQENIFPPLAQWRDLDRHGADAVVKILSKAPSSYSLQQIIVRGGNDAYITPLHSRRAHLDIFPILQDAQEPRLRTQGQFPDLIQKDGATVSLLKVAFACCYSISKGTLFMAKELGVDGALRYRPTVDGDEVLMLAPA